MAGPDRPQRILIIAAIAAFVLIVVGGVGFQAWRTNRAPQLSGQPSGAVTTGQASPVPIVDGRPLVFGSPDNPVRVTLYEDFHCPHCAEFEEEFGPTLTAAVADNRAWLEVYPMSFIDEGSSRAANAMACAAEVGVGPLYFQGLFGNHTLGWSHRQLIQLGRLTGAAAAEGFEACVTNDTHASWVASINAAADQNGVTGTPTVFLDGNPVDLTALTPESLDSMIEQAAR